MALQALNLMIGDWFKYSKGNYTDIRQIQLIDIEMYYEGIIFLEPIPLTAEMMDKNFAINKPYQSQYGTKSLVYYALPSPIYHSGVWNLVWVIGENENYLVIEDDPLIRMKYVHQLQHALKLCNIQKEIQL